MIAMITTMLPVHGVNAPRLNRFVVPARPNIVMDFDVTLDSQCMMCLEYASNGNNIILKQLFALWRGVW